MRPKITHSHPLLNAEIFSSPATAGRNDWHVRFVPPAINGVRRVIFRSTGTKNRGAKDESLLKLSNPSGTTPAVERTISCFDTTMRKSAGVGKCQERAKRNVHRQFEETFGRCE